MCMEVCKLDCSKKAPKTKPFYCCVKTCFSKRNHGGFFCLFVCLFLGETTSIWDFRKGLCWTWEFKILNTLLEEVVVHHSCLLHLWKVRRRNNFGVCGHQWRSICLHLLRVNLPSWNTGCLPPLGLEALMGHCSRFPHVHKPSRLWNTNCLYHPDWQIPCLKEWFDVHNDQISS